MLCFYCNAILDYISRFVLFQLLGDDESIQVLFASLAFF